MIHASVDLFQGAKHLLVKQEFAAVELCSFEAKNRYRVSVPHGDGRQEGSIFLYITEESLCVERICCSVNRRLALKLHQGASKQGPIVLQMEKPFHLQGCCFCRPRFDVF